MSKSLQDFAVERRIIIRNEIKELLKEYKTLKKFVPGYLKTKGKHRKRGIITIKEMCLSILSDGPLSAADLMIEIRNRYELDVPRTSLSPQLSRLKQDGRVVEKEHIWYKLEGEKE